ncbi:MAG TPA: thiamine phosphate synthase [Myxococcota bacterium]|nr:thiamine phosphate synthase [Myxococcota bacterium]
MLDASAARGPLPALVEASVFAGVDWVQVRERALEGSALLSLCDRVSEAARRAASRRGGFVRVLVNRRVDVALAAGADGVHLGGDAMAPADARALLGASAWIGVSTHAPDEIDANSGASYAHLAPVFAPLSKESSRPPLGLAALARATERGLPVLAQGGITPERARDVVAAGAAGVAVTGSVLAADDPAAAVRALRRALDEATRG